MILCTSRDLWRTACSRLLLAGVLAAGPLAAVPFAQEAATANAAAADAAEKVDDPPPPPGVTAAPQAAPAPNAAPQEAAVPNAAPQEAASQEVAVQNPAPQEVPPEPAAASEAPAASRGPRYLPTILQPRSPVRDHQRIIQKRVWSWQEIQDRNVVKQDRDYSCGAASLCTIMRYYWESNVSEQKILDELDKMLDAEETHDRIQNGLSLTDLRQVSVKLGYVASIGTVSFEQLCKSKIPLLVPLKIEEFNHFAVFRGTDGYYVYLADPARGNVRTPIDEFVKQWQKNAVLVVAKKDRDLNENAPLTLQPEEPYLGTLNRVEIQKLVARPIVIMPAVIRP